MKERETRVQLVLQLGVYEDGSPIIVSIAGVARYPDSSTETVEDILTGGGVPGDEASASELMGAQVVGAVNLDPVEIAARDQDAAHVRETIKNELSKPSPIYGYKYVIGWERRASEMIVKTYDGEYGFMDWKRNPDDPNFLLADEIPGSDDWDSFNEFEVIGGDAAVDLENAVAAEVKTAFRTLENQQGM